MTPVETLPISMPGPSGVARRLSQSRSCTYLQNVETAIVSAEADPDDDDPETPSSYRDSSGASTIHVDDSDADETSELESDD